MLANLRKIVSEQLENQAVVIRKTFIEVVDLRRRDESPRPRYFSDSVVVMSPHCGIDCTKSDDCSTDGEDAPVGEQGMDSDLSDMEGIPSLPSELRSACEYAGAWGGTPLDEALPSGSIGPTVDVAEGYPAVGSDDEADTAEGGAEVSRGEGYFDVWGFADRCDSSQGDEELSWRHLRTMSEADGEAGHEHAPPGDEELSWCHLRTMSEADDEAEPPWYSMPLLPAVGAQGLAQPVQRHPQYLAVLVPALLGPSCSAVASGQAESAAATAGRAAGAAGPGAPRAAREPAEAAPASGALRRQCAQEAPRRRTTVMLRNIPNNYTRDRFLALLDRVGLAGLYDFAYLPLDFRTGSSLGYAFLNLVDVDAVQLAWEVLDGFSRWATPSRKRCSVSWNDPHQGFEENVERYRDSPVMHPSVPDECKPVLLSNGVRIPYPAPTKAIRAPRLRKFA